MASINEQLAMLIRSRKLYAHTLEFYELHGGVHLLSVEEVVRVLDLGQGRR